MASSVVMFPSSVGIVPLTWTALRSNSTHPETSSKFSRHER